MEKISVTDLAEQYERQYNIINAKIAGLRPLLYVYTGEDLYLLRRRIKTYYEMATECRITAVSLKKYYEDEHNERLH